MSHTHREPSRLKPALFQAYTFDINGANEGLGEGLELSGRNTYLICKESKGQSAASPAKGDLEKFGQKN